MAFKISNKSRGRPSSITKTRSISYVTPKGFEFTHVDKKNKKFIFKKV